MKRINLIPEKARKPKISRLVLVICAVFVAVNLWQISLIFYYKISSLAVKNKVSLMQGKLDDARIESSAIINEGEAVKKETKSVQEKLNILQAAFQENIAWAGTLERLSKLLPGDLWVNKVALNKDVIALSGTAFDNAIISKFMSGLDASGYFSGTSFTYTKKTQSEGMPAVDFEVTTHLILEKAGR